MIHGDLQGPNGVVGEPIFGSESSEPAILVPRQVIWRADPEGCIQAGRERFHRTARQGAVVLGESGEFITIKADRPSLVPIH